MRKRRSAGQRSQFARVWVESRACGARFLVSYCPLARGKDLVASACYAATAQVLALWSRLRIAVTRTCLHRWSSVGKGAAIC